jgi:NAD(P)-dependent dehydrogenase (short-subunit alcohol dehydrogenase family)
MMTGRTASKLESVQDEIRAKGGTVKFEAGDIGARTDVDGAVERTIAVFGGVDILVNNARTWEPDRSVLEITDEILEVPFRSGLLGSLYAMQACYQHLKARGGGSIVNFGSTTGVIGMVGWGPYSIAKKAVRGLTKAAAREWGPDNIRVNTVCPAGLTGRSTAMAEADPVAWDARVKGIYPLGRLGDPEQDIGRAIAALVSDDLAYLTGATLMLDGGSHFLS